MAKRYLWTENVTANPFKPLTLVRQANSVSVTRGISGPENYLLDL